MSVLTKQALPPGDAGKLQGKLQFAESPFFGKVGRALLRALSDRQHDDRPGAFGLTAPLEGVLKGWLMMLAGKAAPHPLKLPPELSLDFFVFFVDLSAKTPTYKRMSGLGIMRGSRKP